ncbi:hypothetical protein [Clostridium perfringens]|uniref:hypothetical protein n=1 Tax=Clostridium perfringens TaxID=1502 RepID=UPI0013E2AC73|nr:hypothetical protein [Clostridium perfringens]EHA1006717.1 hypothetical protein [Clostridium perfringens]EHA1009635.1 hypothetical protein [Clostridium perfringens]EHA1021702.1 hypothetical protein [Clostridium perfringens]EJT6342183.1 hypothetical protein [Clostridium perfringens]NGT58534.1 hypothetical protein [Clostridium perfringens]
MTKVYWKNKIINREEGEYFIDWSLHNKLLNTLNSLEKDKVFDKYFMSYSIRYHDEYIKLILFKKMYC